MSASSGSSPPKRHGRYGSSGRALPRRSTRGPLDIGESPISINPAAVGTDSNPSTPNKTQPNLPIQSSNLSATSFATAPRGISPQPSNVTFLTAKSNLSSPTHSTLAATNKDFSSLLQPEIYHPLTLLDVPPPFRVTTNQPDQDTELEELLSSGYFRNAAIKAAQLLTTIGGIDPKDHNTIFSLLYIRLSCLTLCNSTPLAAQEARALEDLNSAYYRDEETGIHLCPWELRVLAVRLQGMGFNDVRRGIMGYYDLVREVRQNLTVLKKQRRHTTEAELEPINQEIQLWEQRLSDLSIRIASALVEMEDLEGAARFLSSLPSTAAKSNANLPAQKALLWLCIGDVEAARGCINADLSDTTTSQGGNKEIIQALTFMADADFTSAASIWEKLISSQPSSAQQPLYKQNLAVCLLYLGRMEESRTILESLLTPTHHSFHALTFNLSTIYELCTERSRALKIGLAEQVAGMLEEERERRAVVDEGNGQAGGRQGAVVIGWEKVNGDFKL